MTDTLELPDGNVVTPGEVLLYNGYPYRYVPADGDGSTGGDSPEFHLSPLYWGGGEMDVPFTDRAALVEQWEPADSGVPDADGWEAWLADARADDRFGDEELDAVARELPGGDTPGLLARLRRLLG